MLQKEYGRLLSTLLKTYRSEHLVPLLKYSPYTPRWVGSIRSLFDRIILEGQRQCHSSSTRSSISHIHYLHFDIAFLSSVAEVVKSSTISPNWSVGDCVWLLRVLAFAMVVASGFLKLWQGKIAGGAQCLFRAPFIRKVKIIHQSFVLRTILRPFMSGARSMMPPLLLPVPRYLTACSSCQDLDVPFRGC